MIFFGYFNNVDNSNTYYVRIGDIGAEKEIKPEPNPDEENICFSWDPVIINSDREDTFENVYSRTLSLNLTANYNITDYFVAVDDTDLPIEIRYDNEYGDVIFSGYIEPLQLNQEYMNISNDLEINAIDKLGLLENRFLMDIENAEEFISDYKTPREIINFILNGYGFDSINYDIKNDKTDTTYINPYIFIGESQDEWMNCKEILNEIGKIYGCWFYQNGNTLNIKNLISDINISNKYQLRKEDFRSDNTNISLSDCYNYIKLTDNIETPDSTIFNPFDEDNIISDFTGKYYYMDELICPGEGNSALQAFKDMVRGTRTVEPYNGETPEIRKHYVQVYKNPILDFGNVNYLSCESQDAVLRFMKTHDNKGAFLAFGKTENTIDQKNTDDVHSIDMQKYFCISVNGHQRNDQYATMISSHTEPVFSITIPTTINIIPNDQNTVNYIVFSGSIFLDPIHPKTGPMPENIYWNSGSDYDKSTNTCQMCKDAWGEQRTQNNQTEWATLFHRTVPHEHKDGAYYQMKFKSGDNVLEMHGMVDNSKQKKYQYNFNQMGERRDSINKVQVLACQLKIGDKYLVERLDLPAGMNKFEWLKEEDLYEVDGEKINYFTIGFNPKIEDYIIGQKYDIQDTRKLEWNLDKKGTCIPIKFEDNLHGEMEFKILGPVLSTWSNNKEIKHGWWFWSSTKYRSDEVLIMEQVETIFIQNFKIDIVSDNGKINNNSGDNDLVYYSETSNKGKEEKSYETVLCTSLTSEEASSLGIDYNLTNSAIMEKTEDELLVPFYGFDYHDYSTGEDHPDTKLEEARVYEQFQLWSKPRRIIETTLKLKEPDKFTYNCNYRLKNENWKFDSTAVYNIISEEISLHSDTMKVKMKNINQ